MSRSTGLEKILAVVSLRTIWKPWGKLNWWEIQYVKYTAQNAAEICLGVKNHCCHELAGFLSLVYTKLNFGDWSVCLLGEPFTGCAMLGRTADPQTPGANVLRKPNAEGCVPLWSKMLSISLLLENIIRRIFGRGNAKFLVKLVEYLWQIWIRNFLWRRYKNNRSSQVNNVFNVTTFVIMSTLIFTDYDECKSEKLK